MICLVLCCSCTSCHQKHSRSPSPLGRARDAKHIRPEVQADPFTSSLGHTPASQSILDNKQWGHIACWGSEPGVNSGAWSKYRQQASRHDRGPRCMECVTSRQQASRHDRGPNYTGTGWARERTGGNGSRGHHDRSLAAGEASLFLPSQFHWTCLSPLFDLHHPKQVHSSSTQVCRSIELHCSD